MGITNTASTALSSLASNGNLGTGLNVTQLVATTIQSESGPLNILQNQQNQLSAQTSALNNLNTDLTTLQTSVQNLTSLTGALNAQKVSSSDSTVLTATADTTAQQAVHSVTVTSLATTASYYTNPAVLPATGSTPLATGGTFTVVAGSTSAPITIDTTNNTLTGLASAINNSAAGTSVTASVIQDSTGARLTVVSNTSGAPGDITITDPGNSTGLTFTKPVTGTNAVLAVDGVPISSATNTVTGVLQGVTLSLVSAKPGTPVTLTAQADTTQVTTAVNQFVTAYNKVVGDLNAQFTVDPATGNAGVLAADSALGNLQQQLFNAVNTTGSGSIANLASIGISTQQDGTLQVNSATLASSLAGNFSGVQSFFQSTTSGVGLAFSSALTTLTDPTQGAVFLDLKGISQEQSSLKDQISQVQFQLSAEQQRLVIKYSRVNTILQQLPALQSQITQQLARV